MNFFRTFPISWLWCASIVACDMRYTFLSVEFNFWYYPVHFYDASSLVAVLRVEFTMMIRAMSFITVRVFTSHHKWLKGVSSKAIEQWNTLLFRPFSSLLNCRRKYEHILDTASGTISALDRESLTCGEGSKHLFSINNPSFERSISTVDTHQTI